MTIGKKRLSADHTIFVLFLAMQYYCYVPKALHAREDSDEIKVNFLNTGILCIQHVFRLNTPFEILQFVSWIGD
jgi:hypothetical protein